MTDRRQFMALAGATALLPHSGMAKQRGDTAVALTTNGPVRGFKDQNSFVFKGVRYGAPTQTTRFAKPQPAQPWQNVADCFEYGAAAPQRNSKEPINEDCLFINIWTPAVNDGGRRAVMVYFHGGAYAAGSGAAAVYDGKRLAQKGDVVVITVNHRLNAFGYLSLQRLNPAFPDSGNAGMWDLVLALQWIKANAAAFGGDSDRIFTFGQSGGGAKIATLMAAPAAKGLISSAATMSGQQVTACGPLNGQSRARAFLDTVGIHPDDTEGLRKVEMEKLIDALASKDPVNPAFRLYFGPVVDGRFLPRHPFWPDAPQQSRDIPMLLGNTHDETRNLIGGKEPRSFDLDWVEVPNLLARHMRCDIDPHYVTARYRELYPNYTASDVFFAATTAGRSWRGQVEEADARARDRGPSWVYQFDYPSTDDGGKWGAPHGIDIAFAFDNLAQSGMYTGTRVEPSADSMRVADKFSRSFIAMAKTGNPNIRGLPRWRRHSLPSRGTMIFDSAIRFEDDPRKGEREIFAQVPFTQWGT